MSTLCFVAGLDCKDVIFKRNVNNASFKGSPRIVEGVDTVKESLLLYE